MPSTPRQTLAKPTALPREKFRLSGIPRVHAIAAAVVLSLLAALLVRPKEKR